jgi:archaemetzincin
MKSRPVRPTAQKGTLYILPIGPFDADQERVLKATESYLATYFQIPVRRLEPLALDAVPATARREAGGAPQLLTTYILHDILQPRRPDDAVALIGLTAVDLWPGEGWNFVFGQASLSDRVGVWSLYRNGDPDKSDEEYRLCLRRTLKTASHEMGHMFSIQHCTAYECNMCGSNNREEADRRPLADCPECMAKVCWATDANPAERYEKLAAFCRRRGLGEDAATFAKLAEALKTDSDDASATRK